MIFFYDKLCDKEFSNTSVLLCLSSRSFLTVHGDLFVGIWKWDTPEILTSDRKQKRRAALLSFYQITVGTWIKCDFGQCFQSFLQPKFANNCLYLSFFFLSPCLEFGENVNHFIWGFFLPFGQQKTQTFKFEFMGLPVFFNNLFLALIFLKRYSPLEK